MMRRSPGTSAPRSSSIGAAIKNSWRLLLPLVGIAILAYLFWKVGLQEVTAAIVDMDLRYLALLPPLVIGVLLVVGGVMLVSAAA